MPCDAQPTSTPRKPIFDAVRRLLKRGFRQREVDALDDVLDDVLQPEFDRAVNAGIDRVPKRGLERAQKNSRLDSVSGVSGIPLIKRKFARKISPAGIALIKKFEGCARLRTDGRIEAYPDPGTGGDPWTIGWGATGAGIAPGVVWTQQQCDERFERDLERYAADVARAIGDAPVTQSQFDALVSFHYNTGAIARATLTRKHVAGDYDGALAEFARWNKAGGRVLKGLVRRRADEAALYRS